LDVMRADTDRMRPNAAARPWVMTNLKTLDGLADVVAHIEKKGMLTI
ncbi:MAG: urease accessory protein UreG, partial [Burkholderiaceae bacterium]|nr:urease accessory protein UreG [Burkholderiaceae bacterium]